MNINKFKIEVNYNYTFEKMILLGRYGLVYIDKETQYLSGVKNGKTKTTTMFTINFGYEISSEYAVNELTGLGLRPANMFEVMTIGYKMPDLQTENQIVSFIHTPKKGKESVILGNDEKKGRCILVDSIEIVWGVETLILASPI